MFTRHRFLVGMASLWLGTLGGCRSVLNLPPVQEIRGGFTVLAGLPDQPNATRVFADVGTFASQRGFVRESGTSATQVDPTTQQPVPSGAERYRRDTIKLDVSYDAAHLRVIAFLHSNGGNSDRRFIGQFYRDFRQTYAGSYGGDGTIVENSFADEASVPTRGGGGERGGRSGGGSR